MDAILINQLSEEDTVVVEINKGNTKFVAVSIYLPIGKEIVEDLYKLENMWFVQKVSGLTTVHEVDKAYGSLTLNVNTVPLCSYTLCPTFLPLLETFCKLLFLDV
jgi:hypothetical protein